MPNLRKKEQQIIFGHIVILHLKLNLHFRIGRFNSISHHHLKIKANQGKWGKTIEPSDFHLKARLFFFLSLTRTVVFYDCYCPILVKSIATESGFERNGEWLVFS